MEKKYFNIPLIKDSIIKSLTERKLAICIKALKMCIVFESAILFLGIHPMEVIKDMNEDLTIRVFDTISFIVVKKLETTLMTNDHGLLLSLVIILHLCIKYK
jgi:hypothetical protein